MREDAELLRVYVEENADAPFGEFVQRHVDFVFACALRRVGGDAFAAEDVTQQVFVAAARDARRLAVHPVVTAWLYTATRNAAAQYVRGERRRKTREQEAEAMKDNANDGIVPETWQQLRPVLDRALDELSERDRQAVLLRFFEGCSFAEIGRRLQVAENAARMRVDRALDKLSGLLRRRGVTSTASALGILLANQTGVSAPAGLAAAATGAALAGAAAGTGGAIAASATFMSMTKLQLAVAGAVLAAGTTGFVVQSRATSALKQEQVRQEQAAPAAAAAVAENQELRRERQESEARRNAQNEEIERTRQQVARLTDQTRDRQRGMVRVTAPASAPFTGESYDIKEISQIPRVEMRPPPEYPRELRNAGVMGEAVVAFIVDADGTPRNVHAVDGTHPAFIDSAVSAVERWHFTPGRKDGVAVATRMQVPVVFKLNDEGSAKAAAKGKK